MVKKIHVFDSTASDILSKVRGVGRYIQLLRENFPDWIFTDQPPATNHELPNTTFINPFFNFLTPPLTMKRVAKKQIAVIHDLIPLKYPNHFPTGLKRGVNIYLNKFALKNYDYVVTDSQASKKDIVRMLKIPEDKVKVIYPCLSKIFSSKYKTLTTQNTKYPMPNSNYFLYVGDATWNKNLVNLAHGVKLAAVTCIFVGKTFENNTRTANNIWLREYNEFRMLADADKRFIFKGFISDYELVKLYQQSVANLLLSRDEGFGFSYLEAAQFGCPSVLADIPVLKEVSGGDGGLFCDYDNPNDIAEKIKKLAQDENLRNVLSLEAQERAKSFNKKKFKTDWMKII